MSNLYIDISYCKQLGPRLERFKIKNDGSNFLANCRCPLCGDSTKKKSKMRFYFYIYKGSLSIKCFNCGAAKSFGNFLKEFDPNLYNRYALDSYSASITQNKPKEKKQKTLPDFRVKLPTKREYITDSLQSIDDLQDTHPVKKYVTKRQIPEEYWSKIFYAPKYFEWAKGHTDKFDKLTEDRDHPRLIIPWYSDTGELFAYSARAFGKEEPKYFSITLNPDIPKFYGEERLNPNKPIIVVEGPIDSMFVPNSIAVGNASLGRFDQGDIYIPDRDVRNKEVMEIVEGLIDAGKAVCMLPLDLKGKDLNEIWINHNMTKNTLLYIIQHNTYKGPEAKLKFMQWSKV